MRYVLRRENVTTGKRGEGQRNCGTFSKTRWKDIAISDNFDILKNYPSEEIKKHYRYKIEDRQLLTETAIS